MLEIKQLYANAGDTAIIKGIDLSIGAGVVKGEEQWRAIKWFRSFGSAVQEAVHAEIREHPATTVVEAIKAVDTIVQRYAQLIPCEFEIKRKDTSE